VYFPDAVRRPCRCLSEQQYSLLRRKVGLSSVHQDSDVGLRLTDQGMEIVGLAGITMCRRRCDFAAKTESVWALETRLLAN